MAVEFVVDGGVVTIVVVVNVVVSSGFKSNFAGNLVADVNSFSCSCCLLTSATPFR